MCGGSLVTNSAGLSRQYFGTFSGTYFLWAAIACGIFIMYYVVNRRWTTTWVDEGGMALSHEEHERRIREGLIPEVCKAGTYR